MKIYLDKDLVKDLDTDALLVYVALRSIYHKGEEEIYVSINMLCYRLYGNVVYTRTFRDSIIHGFSTLCARGIIRVEEQINKTEFIIDAKGLFFENKFFVGIDLDCVRRICNCSGRVDRGSLLKYLLAMVGSIDQSSSMFGYKKKGFVGYMPIVYIAQQAGVSEQTALSYNTILEDCQVIFIYRHGRCYVDEDTGEIRTINNHYGLFEDKDMIIKFGDEYDKMHGFEPLTNIKMRAKANNRRSLAAKYRALCNGTEYTKEEAQEIYDYIHSENVKLQEMIDKKVYKWEEMVPKLRDESVFEGVI